MKTDAGLDSFWTASARRVRRPHYGLGALAALLIGVSIYQELTSNRIACGDLDAARQWMWDRAGVIDSASAAEQCEFYAKGKAVYQAMKLCVPDFKYDPNVEARITQTVQAKKAQCP